MSIIPRTSALRLIVCLKLIALFLLLAATAASQSQDMPGPLFNGLRWRLIGPFRAGRVVAVSGVPGSDGDFFFGSVDGGVWKTTDAGTVWEPIFDHEQVASIGALVVAPSDPKVIYAGTGESDIRSDLASGDGMYRSDDGGLTWKHIGLEDSRQISRILVDPTDARAVYVGVLGHAYGPNDERGVYKSTDGGDHWQRVLDKGPDVGIADIAMAARRPQVVFAATWNTHRPPWATYAPVDGSGNGIYRSTDGGTQWVAITGRGLPEGKWGRIGIAVGADGRRVYATIDCPGHSGLYRSDDKGETWTLANGDARITSRAWYFNSLTIDPTNDDVLYVPNVALYRTEDGGKSIEIVRGAPGGDDYHQIWVDPRNSSHLMLGVDQGATVSLDRGKTWTTWYNQPTAQLYHVTTDHAFPYTVYGAQQDSGAIAVHSRSDHGHVDTRDWFLPGGSESGYIAIDPKNENLIYLSGAYGDVQRFDRRTAFSQNITPWPLGGFGLPINKRKYRDPGPPAMVFSPADNTSLYLGTQYVMKTADGGLHWDKISPDLTGAVAGTAEDGATTVENAKERGYGVVYAIAPSPLKADEVWAGSDTGLVHLTVDGGKNWRNVTPPALPAWSRVSMIEASRFDAATAYVAVDRSRLDDRKPYLYVTHDYGKSWKLKVSGIATSHFVRAVREDTENRNLVFAGTEFGIYVSFDQGDSWQSLNMNLPVTSIRDMALNGSDLVAATHGRSFWVLDDIAPLRQMAEMRAAKAYLCAPTAAVRVDNDVFLGTPLPPEEPQASNPPNGAILDYYLQSGAQKVALQILDSQGHVLRHFSSSDTTVAKRPLLPIAERWFPQPETLQASSGAHRFVWDLASGGAGSGMDDDDEDESAVPPGPRVPPGMYTVRLTVDGTMLDRTLKVTMDPRADATTETLMQQFTTANTIYAETLQSRKAMAELESVESQLKKMEADSESQPAELEKALRSAKTKLGEIKGGDMGEDKDKGENAIGLSEANAGLGVALRMVESGHRSAPSQAMAISEEMGRLARTQVAAWQKFKTAELAQLNAALVRAKRKPLEIAAIEEQVHYAMTR